MKYIHKQWLTLSSLFKDPLSVIIGSSSKKNVSDHKSFITVSFKAFIVG